MGGLKEHQFCESDEFFREYTGPLSNETHLYYLKSEADKVIAELKAQKAQADDDCAYWKTMSRKCADDNEVMAKQRADAFKRERHQKYKRCLAVARRCHSESLWWYSKGYGFEKYDKFWEKWERRWLELAEKFKESV